MDWLMQEFKALFYWCLVIGVFGIGLIFADAVASVTDNIFKSLFKKGDEHD